MRRNALPSSIKWPYSPRVVAQAEGRAQIAAEESALKYERKMTDRERADS